MRAISVAVASCSVGLPARADDVPAAKQHFERGGTLYDLQRYLEAAHEYELAYEAKPDPVFLFDIGQAYRLGGEPAKALGAYKAYRRHAPAAATRAGVDSRIADLEKVVISQKSVPPPIAPAPASPLPEKTPVSAPPVATTPPLAIPAPTPKAVVSPSTGRTKTIAGAVVGGVGLGLLATGIALAVVGHSAYDTLHDPPSGYVFDPATQNAMNVDHPVGLALIGVGAAAVVAGAAVLVLGLREHRRSFASLPTLGSSSTAAPILVRF